MRVVHHLYAANTALEKSAEVNSAIRMTSIAFAVQVAWSLFVLLLGVGFIALGGAFGVGLGIFFLVPTILFLVVAWAYCLAPVNRGDFRAAQGTALLLGILGIPLGVLVVGILYLVAYQRIKRAGDVRAPPTVASRPDRWAPPPGTSTGSAPAWGPAIAARPYNPSSPAAPRTAPVPPPAASVDPALAPWNYAVAPSAFPPSGSRSPMPASPIPTARGPSSMPSACPTCRQNGEWVPEYQRYYCFNCNRYVPR